MTHLLEHWLAHLWNHLTRSRPAAEEAGGLDLGFALHDGQTQRFHRRVPPAKRTEHLAVLGKTGTGKSSFLKHCCTQDIHDRRGFVFFDLHYDTTEFLLRWVAAEERRLQRDLSERLILIEPADREYSVGLNVLEQRAGQDSFVQLAEFAAILKQRWHLDSFGARTEELLRNALAVLADNDLTLLELAPLLTHTAFRTTCLQRATNPEVRAYFEARYNRASENLQTVFRDAILNKVSAFTADPHFRHLLGQRRSTFSLLTAMDRGAWIILNLDKGRLGEQAATLGALLLTKLKNALFARRQRQLFTLYCDEIQNLVAYDSGLDTLLSEARKFAISVVSANQFLDQYPPAMRAAILSVGTHVFFQLSSTDADKIAGLLDGGKSLAGTLKNLPPRHFVVKSGHHRPVEGVVPTVVEMGGDTRDLYRRCRERWAKRRGEVEAEIRARQADASRGPEEALRDWD